MASVEGPTLKEAIPEGAAEGIAMSLRVVGSHDH
jgi:hypothetical protein